MLVEIYVGIYNRFYTIKFFNYIKPLFKTLLQSWNRHAVGLFYVEHWWQVAGFKIHTTDKILRLCFSAFGCQKKMICTPYEICRPRLLPVTAEIFVFINISFGCLNKRKADVNVFNVHSFNAFPINHALILWYIYPMYGVVSGNVDSKFIVACIMSLSGYPPFVSPKKQHNGYAQSNAKNEQFPESVGFFGGHQWCKDNCAVTLIGEVYQEDDLLCVLRLLICW